MALLRPLDLSVSQARRFKRAYGSGQVDSERLLNYQMHELSPLAQTGLQWLPVPEFQPPHFYFEGNRRYAMQVVHNDTTYALLSYSIEPQGRVKGQLPFPAVAQIAVEVLLKADLQFLSISAPPTLLEIARLQADVLGYTVQGFARAAALLTRQQQEGYLKLARVNPAGDTPEAGAWREALLAGKDPYEVLAAPLAHIQTMEDAFSAPVPPRVPRK